MHYNQRSTRSAIEGKSALEIPKEVQSAGVPANHMQNFNLVLKNKNKNKYQELSEERSNNIN